MKDSHSKPDFKGSGFTDRILRLLALTVGGFIAVVIALSLLQCSLKKPEAPSWESTFRLPVASEELSAANLLLRFPNGDEWVSESGQIGLYWSDTLDTVTLAANLALPTQSASVPQALNRVTVNAPPQDSVRTPLSDYYAGPAGSVPPFDVSDTDTLGPIAGYTWLAAGSGEAWIRVENQIGLDFDSVTVWLTDPNWGPLGTYDFAGGVPAGTADSLAVGLVGRKFSNQVEYQLFAHTPGGTLLTLSNRYLKLSVRFSDSLSLDSGVLEVPQVVRSTSEDFDFAGNGDVVSMRQATLEAGQLNFSVTNQTHLSAAVLLTVPSFTLSGVALTRNLAVAPQSVLNVSVNLAGYDFQPDAAQAPQYFTVNAQATTVPTSPAQVRIDRRDSVIVSAQLAGVVADRFTGVLAPQQITLPTIQRNLNVPSEWNAFHPAEAALSVELENGSGAGAAVSLRLDNGTDSQIVQGPVAAGSPSAPSVSTLSNNNVAFLLDPFPAWLRAGGVATFGDSVSEVTVSGQDFALARVNVAAPLAVRIDTVTLSGEAERLDIEGSDVPGFVDRMLGGTLHVDLGNHLPVACEVSFFAALDSAEVYSAPDMLLGPVTVAAGHTQVSGAVSDTSRTIAALELTPDNLQLFTHGTLYLGYQLYLPGSSGQVVRFLPADYFALQAWFDLTLENGPDTW